MGLGFRVVGLRPILSGRGRSVLRREVFGRFPGCRSLALRRWRLPFEADGLGFRVSSLGLLRFRVQVFSLGVGVAG